MRSGLAFSTDVYHRNNRKDRNQATMNNMGMERGRMRKEPDNQSSDTGKATAKIAGDRKTAAAASTFRRGDEDPYDSDNEVKRSRKSWKAQSAARSSSAEDFAVT